MQGRMTLKRMTGADSLLAEQRRRYVEELAGLCALRAPALLRAFEAVPREDFLPPGPWLIELADGSPFLSEDDDPGHILHGVGVVLDRARALHNANPSGVGRALETTAFHPGERVLHVGAGLGYYSAIMAELVGPGGQVIAAEIDPALRDQAGRNLSPWPQVAVVGDALEQQLASLDVIYASCGMASIPLSWLRALKPGGRMVLPLTGSQDAGFLFRFERGQEPGFLAARALGFVRFYPCIGLRGDSDVAALDHAMAKANGAFVHSLRLDGHGVGEECWLHGDGWCLTGAESL